MAEPTADELHGALTRLVARVESEHPVDAALAFATLFDTLDKRLRAGEPLPSAWARAKGTSTGGREVT